MGAFVLERDLCTRIKATTELTGIEFRRRNTKSRLELYIHELYPRDQKHKSKNLTFQKRQQDISVFTII